MERWNQTARWSAARHDTRTKRWRPRPQLPEGVLDLALGPMVGPLPMDGWACVPRPLPPLKKTGFHCPWWSSTITRTSRAAAASLPPPRPVPSRPVSPTRSPIPCSSCPVCRFDLSIEKKQNKNEKTLLEGPRDRSIDQHSRRCGARGGSSGGKSRHGVVQAQPVRAGVARSLQGKVAVRTPHPLGRPRPPLPLCQAIASTPVLSYSVYTLTDATERSIGVVGVVVVLQTGALLTYLFCEFFSDNFVVNFVVLSLFLACDFWTVSDSNLQLLYLFLSLRSKPSDEFC